VKSGRKVLETQSQHEDLTAAAFRPDGKEIATAFEYGTVIISDTSTGRLLRTIQLDARCYGLAYLQDGERLLVSHEGTLSVVDAVTGRIAQTLRGCLFSRGDQQVSNDGQVIAELGISEGGVNLGISHLDCVPQNLEIKIDGRTALFPDGKRILVVASDGIKIFETENGREIVRWPLKLFIVLGEASISPDGRNMCAIEQVDSKDTLRVIDLETGRLKKTITLGPVREDWRYASWSPDGKSIVTGAFDYRSVAVWDVATGQEQLRLSLSGRCQGACISPDGRNVIAACGYSQPMLECWEIKTGVKRWSIPFRDDTAPGLPLFSPDGSQLAVAWHGANAAIRLMNPRNGRTLRELPLQRIGTPASLAFSPDGKRIVAGGVEGNVHITDAVTGQEVLLLPGHRGLVSAVGFDASGQRLLSAGRDKITIRDTGPARMPERDPPPQNWREMAERGKLLEAAAEYDKAISLYEQAFAVGGEDPSLKSHLDDLKRIWRLRDERHRKAHMFIHETWPEAKYAGQMKALLSEAWWAFETCRGYGDWLRVRKLYKVNITLGSKLARELEALKNDAEDERKTVKAINEVIEELKKVNDDVAKFLRGVEPK